MFLLNFNFTINELQNASGSTPSSAATDSFERSKRIAKNGDNLPGTRSDKTISSRTCRTIPYAHYERVTLRTSNPHTCSTRNKIHGTSTAERVFHTTCPRRPRRQRAHLFNTARSLNDCVPFKVVGVCAARSTTTTRKWTVSMIRRCAFRDSGRRVLLLCIATRNITSIAWRARNEFFSVCRHERV